MGYQPRTFEEIELIEKWWQAKARVDFWAFRRYMHPNMKLGWWQREIAADLTKFHMALTAGERPMLLIQAPPQHGKSFQVIDYIAWLAGQDPNLRTVYASFSERLGVRANLALQRMYSSAKYQAVFPKTTISSKNAVAVSGQKLRNREILEYIEGEGYFRNTTVGGSITGEGLDLGVIDDPIKGRKEANSLTVRNGVWDWLLDDFMTRFSEGAGLLGIMTRWHIDDPFGRLIAKMPDEITVKRYPAIAEGDEEHRAAGEPLFPEHKSLPFLMKRKDAMHSANWEALYQQNPVVLGGGIFKDEWWKYYTEIPELTHRTIYADTAQKTKEQNDYSVFQCWGKSKDGKAVLIDMVRGKWEAPELLVQARAFWAKQKAVTGKSMGRVRAFKVEDKSSGTGLIQTLKREGMPITGIPRSVDKIVRALDAAPMVESGNVLLPKDAPWLSDFLGEASAFPNGKNDDMVDPMMDAISDMGSMSAAERLAALTS